MRTTTLGAILALICLPLAGARNAPSPQCTDLPAYNLLDFWLGDWDVYAGDQKVGENRIEKILSGCAVMEHWKSAGGGEGKSLFFIDTNGNWKQVWVTGRAAIPGGVKEKALVEHRENGAVRFRGQVRHPEHGPYLDRTTLTPLEGGDVHQLIEISRDGGKTWEATFDAIYERK